MRFRDIFVWLVVFIVGSLVVTFLIYPNSFQLFKQNIASKINSNVISSLQTPFDFKCEEGLNEWLKTEKVKLSSSVSINVIEKKTFTNKTELLEYVDNWNAFNEYEIKQKIEEITKMPEPQGTSDLKREGEYNFVLDFDYKEGDINSMRMVVTKGYFDKETICDETVEGSSGTIECDISDAGEGEFKAEAYVDAIDKIWAGQIDIVLIKEEGEIDYNNVAILIIGICDGEELTF